jgi:hypothetical protein
MFAPAQNSVAVAGPRNRPCIALASQQDRRARGRQRHDLVLATGRDPLDHPGSEIGRPNGEAALARDRHELGRRSYPVEDVGAPAGLLDNFAPQRILRRLVRP